MQVRDAWLATFVVLAAGAGSARADCAIQELGPELLTHAGAKLPADGGILVGWGASTDRKPAGKGDPSQHAYKATAGGKPVSLVMVALAPGLTAYRPKGGATGVVSVKGLGDPTAPASGGRAQVASVEFTFDKAKGAALPAPDVTAVALSEGTARYHEPYGIATAAVASVPDAAVALVIYGVADDEHVPLSFGRPAHDKTGATTVVVFEGAHNCAMNPPGMRGPAAGDEVELAWVDAAGRVSPLSKPVTAK